MSKSWLDARCEGNCDKCNREEMLCKEENKCLRETKFYALIIHFGDSQLKIETGDVDDYKNMLTMLEDAIVYGHQYKKLGKYNICISSITYWYTEEYYG